ncbi:hypothetical protein [Pseudolabrys sp.]|uniref:hypothetical protein n=1 Tax=Pseudolabrys sp. TaxID=1960880 RepID=UPI003D09ABF9
MSAEDKKLYHCFESGIQPGTIIQPGRFGRRIFADGIAHRRWSAELIYEIVRFEHYSNSPSRLYCNYLIEGLEAARFYIQRMAPEWVIYEARIVNSGAPTHRTDFNLIQPLHGTDTWIDAAHKYWRHSTTVTIKDIPSLNCIEILVSSPVELLNPVLD